MLIVIVGSWTKNGSFAFSPTYKADSSAKEKSHLCGWLKIEVGKIKNTAGSAMRVGSVAVQLKYGLYVGHLSKFL